jgi:hypothetical protein
VSGFLGFLVGGLADRLIPILQTPVEDIIYEVLDQKGLPTRAEVRDLRNKLDRLEKTLGDLTTSFETLNDEVGRALDAAERLADAAPAAPAAPKTAAASAPAAAPTIKVKAGGKVCKVDGCDNAVRAKGFCGKHYQKWKRGTLDGYVSADGTTIHEHVHYRVAESAAGQAVITRYEGDEVIFLLPERGGEEIRHKVNDVRID